MRTLDNELTFVSGEVTSVQGVASLALIASPPLLLEIEVMYGARLSQKLETVLKGSPQCLSQRSSLQPPKTVYQSLDLLRTQFEMEGLRPYWRSRV